MSQTIIMSIQQIRQEIDQYLDQVDESFLKVVHAMLTTYTNEQEEDPIIGYDVDGTPMYASQAKEEFQRRIEAVERGEYLTIEELRKESETWLKNTK